MQWGKLASATTTITFPISHSSVVYSMSQMQSGGASKSISRIAYNGFSTTTACKLAVAETSMFPATWMSLGI